MKTKRILLLAIAVILLSLLIYLIVFHRGLSNNHEEWGSFGNYIGGIGGIVLSCSLFYYTYTIDKDHKRTENNAHTLKLIDIISESLTCIQRWQELDRDIEHGNVYDKGQIKDQNLMKRERDKLVIRIWTNYKTAQVLANQLYEINIPNVKEIYEAEQYLIKVFHRIKV